MSILEHFSQFGCRLALLSFIATAALIVVVLATSAASAETALYPGTSVQLGGNTTVTPESPPEGVTSVNVSTDTNFKGTLEADPASGVVRITNAHPAGTYIVTVNYFDGTIAAGSASFTMTVTTPPLCGLGSFTSYAITLPENGFPGPAAVGDLNGDGKQDIVATDGLGALAVLLGDGTGGFASPVYVAVTYASDVAIGDFNGDGKQDLAVPDSDTSVRILLGNGDGSFAAPVSFAAGTKPNAVVVGDFNRDGRQDIAVSDYGVDFGPSAVSILFGDGIGSFSSEGSRSVSANPTAIVIGDFDQNGMQDVALPSFRTGNASILVGNGLGNFTPRPTFTAGTSWDVVVGNFNGDDKQDLLFPNSSGSALFYGDGFGGFNYAHTVGVGGYETAVGDFNSDGKQDIVVTSHDLGPSWNVVIRLGDGAGNFASGTGFVVDAVRNVAVADLNGDGYQDLVLPGFNDDVSIALRTACAPTPTPGIRGTVTYGNAIGSPTTRYVSNAVMNVVEDPGLSQETTYPGGTYALSGFGAGSYTVNPTKTTGQNGITSFDAAKIAQHVAGISPLTGNQFVVADTSGNGTLSSFDAGQVARYAVSSPSYGSAGTWRFIPQNRFYASVATSLAGEDYSALLMGEVSGNWTNTGARTFVQRETQRRGVTVSLPEVRMRSGKQIVIPITVAGIANKGVISYEFDLRYDSSVIQPVADPVDVARTLSRGLSYAINAEQSGLLRIAVYGPMPIDHDGVLLDLKFIPVGQPGSVSPLTFDRILFNEGEPSVTTADSKVELF